MSTRPRFRLPELSHPLGGKALGLFLGLALLIGCGGEEVHPGVVDYLLGDEPLGRLERGEVVERRAVFRNRFDTEANREPTWNVEGRHHRIYDGYRHFERFEEPLVFEHVDLGEDGERLAAVSVRARTSGAAELRLYWAGPDESFDDSRALGLPLRPSARRWERLSFELGDHPQWRPRIDRLRLEVTTLEGNTTLRRIDVERDEVRIEQLEPKLLRPWRVELDDDVRSALVSLPGLSLRRRVKVPATARLRFAYGVLAGNERPVTFEVIAHTEGGGTLQLLRAEVARTPGNIPSWRRMSLDLESLAGQEVELELRNPEPREGIAGIDGIPLWANPEVVGPVVGDRPVNVVVISYDTLRSDRMSLYGNPRPTSPNLDRWAAERGTVFDQAVAAAPWTLPSHVSMFTGLEAFRHGVELDMPAPEGLDLLAELLRARGYRTLGVTGGGYLSPGYGLDQGFDRFRYWTRDPTLLPLDQISDGDIDAQELGSGLGHALSWLDEHADIPFFLFFHTYEMHRRSRGRQPWFDQWSEHAGTEARLRVYRPEERQRDGFERRLELQLIPEAGAEPVALPEDHEDLPYDLYDSCLAYADEAFAQLLGRLDELALSERTLVVFTSDHGELLGEHGLTGHIYLYEDNVLVPLIMAGPGVPTGTRVERQVRSIDIVPTLLDLLGIEPPEGLDGQSLAPVMADPDAPFPPEAWTYVASGNRGIGLRLRNQLKYLFNDTVFAPLNGRERVFDLEKDPEETVAVEGSDQVDAWRGHLRDTFADAPGGLQLRFHTGSAPFPVTLRGPAIRRSSLKSVDLGGPWIRWAERRRVDLEIPAGASFRLSVVAVRGGASPFSIEAIGGDGDLRAFPLEPERLAELRDRPLWLSWDGEDWIPSDAPPANATAFRGLEIWWPGVSADSSDAPEARDDELRRQLEALGYL
ncbi:MAG: sulfatase [Acidobacteriota bacterium]